MSSAICCAFPNFYSKKSAHGTSIFFLLFFPSRCLQPLKQLPGIVNRGTKLVITPCNNKQQQKDSDMHNYNRVWQQCQIRRAWINKDPSACIRWGLLQDELQACWKASMSPVGQAGSEGGGRKSLLSDTGSVRWTSVLHSSPSHTHARVSAVGLERVMWA